jgi:aryl-alcohol dehydrogenase-like predicted oxidoreductase
MVQLGDTDIDTLPVALGANTMGWTADTDTSFAILDAFTDAGGSLIDTADAYSAWAPGNSGGESETVIGEWIASRDARDRIVLATKVSRHPERRGLGAANIRAAIEDSLQRLKTDHVDLYYAHYDDPDTPLEETVTAFAELVDRGRVRHVGLSNYSPQRIGQWLDTARRLGVAPPVALQPHYNLLHREPFESQLAPIATEHELAVLPYFGLAAGFLTGKYRTRQDADGAARGSMVGDYLTDTGFAAAAQLREIAAAHDVAPATVALAWLRGRPAVTAPLAGATRLEQLQPIIDAATFTLDSDELDALERVSDAFQPA